MSKERLEFLRGELRNECISQGELLELQCLADQGFIDPNDVELLEADGVPEDAQKFRIEDWAGNEPYKGRVFYDATTAADFITQDQRERNPNATDKEIEDIIQEFYVVPT